MADSDMEADSSSRVSISPGDASDEDIIRCCCDSPPGAAVWDELAKRCIPRLRKSVIQITFAKSSICPSGTDRQAFVDDVLSRASQYLLRGLPSFGFRGSFDAWLGILAKRAAIDERRAILGRSKEPTPITQSLDEIKEKGGDTSTEHSWLRSKYASEPAELVRDREHRELVTSLLILHARVSNRDRESARAIRLRIWDNATVTEIAARRGTTDRDVFRLFAHDYAKLRDLLYDHFGIRTLRNI